MQEMVVMGRIVAPYGVLGWVKVLPDTEQVDGLRAYKTWWVGRDNDLQSYAFEKVKIHNDVLLVKLQDVNDRDAAFALKGQQVSVPKAELPVPEEDAYYWADLIGLQVSNLQGVMLGKVVDVFETGANDVLAVREATSTIDKQGKKVSKERLIPFIDQVISDVDLEQQQMIVDWDENY